MYLFYIGIYIYMNIYGHTHTPRPMFRAKASPVTNERKSHFLKESYERKTSQNTSLVTSLVSVPDLGLEHVPCAKPCP